MPTGRGVRFVVVSLGTEPPHETFAAAVEAARAQIQTFEYRDGALTHYSRVFVALRQESRYALPEGVSSGVDEELVRWEVYPDAVAMVPPGKGGLAHEQSAAVSPMWRAGRGQEVHA